MGKVCESVSILVIQGCDQKHDSIEAVTVVRWLVMRLADRLGEVIVKENRGRVRS